MEGRGGLRRPVCGGRSWTRWVGVFSGQAWVGHTYEIPAVSHISINYAEAVAVDPESGENVLDPWVTSQVSTASSHFQCLSPTQSLHLVNYNASLGSNPKGHILRKALLHTLIRTDLPCIKKPLGDLGHPSIQSVVRGSVRRKGSAFRSGINQLPAD